MDITGVRYVTRQKTDMRGMMKRCLVGWILLFLLASQGAWAANDYMNSAHGDLNNGVFRTAMGTLGYAKGNCAHCHEMHASIEGSNGSPAPFTLFAQNFDTSVHTGPYQEADNFCFYCHNSGGSAQHVDNYDYSEVFGCATSGPTSILSAFNQTSYHNLYDIWNFAKDEFSWFKGNSNPCNACHNPHLAKRNWTDPDNPLLTAISKPSDHFSLWGATDLMSTYSYEAPYCSGAAREPDGTGTQSGSTTPDYIEFCTDCHNTINTLGVSIIDWSSAGDKHGEKSRDGGIDIEEPYYAANATNSNFVLSCLDCHEPHGAPNIMLIRRRVNGGNLFAAVSSSSNTLGYLCTRCHKDDADAGTGPFNEWEFVHHDSDDAPYPSPRHCGTCHGGGGTPPIDCDNCHFHNGNF